MTSAAVPKFFITKQFAGYCLIMIDDVKTSNKVLELIEWRSTMAGVGSSSATFRSQELSLISGIYGASSEKNKPEISSPISDEDLQTVSTASPDIDGESKLEIYRWSDFDDDEVPRTSGRSCSCASGFRILGLCIHSSEELVRKFCWNVCSSILSQPYSLMSSSEYCCGREGIRLPMREFCCKFGSILWRQCPWKIWWRANLLVIFVVLFLDILVYELAYGESRRQRYGTAILFPLQLSNAAGLAFAARWEGSISPGNYIGFLLGHAYKTVRNGNAILDLLRFPYSVLQAFIRVLEVQSGAYLLNAMVCRRLKRMPTIVDKREAGLYFLSVFMVSLIFETVVSVVECASGLIPWSRFAVFWSAWWMADIAAYLTLSPLFILILDAGYGCRPGYSSHFRALVLILRKTCRIPGRKRLKFVLLADLTAFFVCLITFSDTFTTVFRPLPYLLFLLMIFSAVYASKSGWALILACVAFFSSWGALRNHTSALYDISEHFSHESPLFLAQISLFMAALGSASIFLVGALEEERQLAKDFNNSCETKEDLGDEFELANPKHRIYDIFEPKRRKRSSVTSECVLLMIHDLRAPLDYISSNSAAILKRSAFKAAQAEQVKTMKSCADVLLHILNHVVDLRRFEVGEQIEIKCVPFSIRRALRKNKRMFQALALEEGSDYISCVADSVPAIVAGDPGKLQQIVVILVTNALRCTRRGTVALTISVQEEVPAASDADSQDAMVQSLPSSVSSLQEAIKSQSKTVTVKAAREKGFFEMQMGIISEEEELAGDVHGNEEMKDKIKHQISQEEQSEVQLHIAFEISAHGSERMGVQVEHRLLGTLKRGDPLSRARLGLRLVKRLVEAQDGQISVSPTPEKGTTIFFVLPYRVVKTTTRVPGPSDPPATTIQRQSRESRRQPIPRIILPPRRRQLFTELKRKVILRILLVEGNKIYMRMAEQQLRVRGHVVATVSNGAQASDLLLGHHDRFDLVLMDVSLSKTVRFDAPCMIREIEVERNWTRLPIFGLTTSAVEDYRIALPTEDMDAYLGKPFVIDQLLDIINELGN